MGEKGETRDKNNILWNEDAAGGEQKSTEK